MKSTMIRIVYDLNNFTHLCVYLMSRKCSVDPRGAAAHSAPSARGAEAVHVASGEGSSLGSAAGEDRAGAEMQSIGLAAENVPIHSEQGARN